MVKPELGRVILGGERYGGKETVARISTFDSYRALLTGYLARGLEERELEDRLRYYR